MMIQKQKKMLTADVSAGRMQFYCLLALGLMELLLMIGGEAQRAFAFYIAENYLMIPGLLFWGAAMVGKKSALAKRNLILGAAMVLWFALAQTVQHIHGEYPYGISLWWSAYLLALPFAAVTQDGKRQKGLRVTAVLYIAAALILTLYAVLLLAEALPESLRDTVKWDGARLMAVWHPNITACILLIGMAFCLGFFFEVQKTWCKAALIAAAAVQFAAMALTNCRTSILIACAFCAGVVFFCICRRSWIRFAAGVLAALVVFAAMFVTADFLFEKNQEILTRETAGSTEFVQERSSASAASGAEGVVIPTVNAQGSLLNDLKTLNGRTEIWKAALRAVRDQPSILLKGVRDIGPTVTYGGNPFPVEHAHNSWMEMLVGFGLPGLLMALYFTWIAVKNALILLLREETGMWKKCVAMLTLCLLVTGALEPFLFTGYVYYNFINVIFFLCTGYLDQWREELRAA